MKSVNLKSIIEAYRNLSSEIFHKLLKDYEINPLRDYELDTLEKLADNLLEITGDISVLDKYYIGYKIPQIEKEFDLLRFGDKSVINIELKTESTDEKILRQQNRNLYYLSFLQKEVHIYTYVLNDNKLYKLIVGKDANQIEESTFEELARIILMQDAYSLKHLDDLFNPSNYLVSPFNSTETFVEGKYFLTKQQEQICEEINNVLNSSEDIHVSITGEAGTGKTLLTYHIAKSCMQEGKKVLILHCAQLNSGQILLNKNWGWNIKMPKYAYNISDYDIIIIDEAQRLYPTQFDRIVLNASIQNQKFIFSYDEMQYLSNSEKGYVIHDKIEKSLSCKTYTLTNKIRTNKEISYFIKQLFNQKLNISNRSYPNVELHYCKFFSSAKRLLCILSDDGWGVINYTPGLHSFFPYEKYSMEEVDSAHSVIGQEFDNIVVVIDSAFKYDSSGSLVADNTCYSQSQMLYQIITRARKKLCLVIIDNETILDRCLDILSNTNK